MEYFITIYLPKKETKTESYYTTKEVFKRIEELVVSKAKFAISEGQCVLDLS